VGGQASRSAKDCVCYRRMAIWHRRLGSRAESEIGWVIDVVTAIRSARAEMNVKRSLFYRSFGESVGQDGKITSGLSLERMARIRKEIIREPATAGHDHNEVVRTKR